jgi:hypothetical protein
MPRRRDSRSCDVFTAAPFLLRLYRLLFVIAQRTVGNSVGGKRTYPGFDTDRHGHCDVA